MHFIQYPDRAWGLVQTRPCFEKKVLQYIERCGLPCYLPLARQVKSRYRISHLPIFRRYLFAAWNIHDRRLLAMCSNIVNYIEVPPGCDTDIIAQMESLYKIELLSEPRGPLKGFTGYWKELNGKYVFAVIMNVLECKFEATMDGAGLICD